MSAWQSFVGFVHTWVNAIIKWMPSFLFMVVWVLYGFLLQGFSYFLLTESLACPIILGCHILWKGWRKQRVTDLYKALLSLGLYKVSGKSDKVDNIYGLISGMKVFMRIFFTLMDLNSSFVTELLPQYLGKFLKCLFIYFFFLDWEWQKILSLTHIL